MRHDSAFCASRANMHLHLATTHPPAHGRKGTGPVVAIGPTRVQEADVSVVSRREGGAAGTSVLYVRAACIAVPRQKLDEFLRSEQLTVNRFPLVPVWTRRVSVRRIFVCPNCRTFGFGKAGGGDVWRVSEAKKSNSSICSKR
jgi:hypothetical protein